MRLRKVLQAIHESLPLLRAEEAHLAELEALEAAKLATASNSAGSQAAKRDWTSCDITAYIGHIEHELRKCDPARQINASFNASYLDQSVHMELDHERFGIFLREGNLVAVSVIPFIALRFELTIGSKSSGQDLHLGDDEKCVGRRSGTLVDLYSQIGPTSAAVNAGTPNARILLETAQMQVFISESICGSFANDALIVEWTCFSQVH